MPIGAVNISDDALGLGDLFDNLFTADEEIQGQTDIANINAQTYVAEQAIASKERTTNNIILAVGVIVVVIIIFIALK